jgi:hypothetical protein
LEEIITSTDALAQPFIDICVIFSQSSVLSWLVYDRNYTLPKINVSVVHSVETTRRRAFKLPKPVVCYKQRRTEFFSRGCWNNRGVVRACAMPVLVFLINMFFSAFWYYSFRPNFLIYHCQ